jgi:hypothetical protein
MPGHFGHELKYSDTAGSSQQIAASPTYANTEIQPEAPAPTGGIRCLNAVQQGSGVSQRIGTKICMKSILIKYQVFANPVNDPTTGIYEPTIFLAIVMDTQTNLAALAPENVWDNLAGNFSGISTPQRNMSNASRYRVLKTKSIKLRQFSFNNTNKSNNVETYNGIMKINLAGICVDFVTDSTEGTVAQIIRNSIHLVANCSTTDYTTFITYNCRMRFKG